MIKQKLIERLNDTVHRNVKHISMKSVTTTLSIVVEKFLLNHFILIHFMFN